MTCNLLGHRYREIKVIRRTNETTNGGMRVVFVLLECQRKRCGHLKEAARLEIDKLLFPGGVKDWSSPELERKP